MGIVDDQYALYVYSAYGSTAVILAWLLWTTLRASARARRELEEAERERKR